MNQMHKSKLDICNTSTCVDSLMKDEMDRKANVREAAKCPVKESKENAANEAALPEGIIVHYLLNFRDMCVFTLACPLITILTCLITAFIFQPDDIHETHCRVYNVIPSISAITGISPQKYLWRISVAVHLGPRLLIAAVTRSYHQNAINTSAHPKDQEEARKWIDLTFWVQLVEIASLSGVTYISNRENYPAHEKIFITFMASSILHMWASIKSTLATAKTDGNVDKVEEKVKRKKALLGVSIVSLMGIVGFFLQHRFLCHNLAFSWFALCEYIFAIANITFHFDVMTNFPTETLIVGKGFKRSARPPLKVD